MVLTNSNNDVYHVVDLWNTYNAFQVCCQYESPLSTSLSVDVGCDWILFRINTFAYFVIGKWL